MRLAQTRRKQGEKQLQVESYRFTEHEKCIIILNYRQWRRTKQKTEIILHERQYLLLKLGTPSLLNNIVFCLFVYLFDLCVLVLVLACFWDYTVLLYIGQNKPTNSDPSLYSLLLCRLLFEYSKESSKESGRTNSILSVGKKSVLWRHSGHVGHQYGGGEPALYTTILSVSNFSHCFLQGI